MKSIDQIKFDIHLLEKLQEKAPLDQDQKNFLEVLRLSFDLLNRYPIVVAAFKLENPHLESVFIPEEEFETNANPLADFCYSVATKTGMVSLQNLISHILDRARSGSQHLTHGKLAEKIGIRPATISNYLNGQKNMTAGNMENLINATLVE